MKRLTSRSAIALLLALASATAGCVSWEEPDLSPAPFVMRKHPGTVRVHLAGGDSVMVWQPVVHGDSLVGLIPGSAPAGSALLRFARPLDDIERLTIRRLDFGKNLLLVTGPVAVFAWNFFLLGF